MGYMLVLLETLFGFYILDLLETLHGFFLYSHLILLETQYRFISI